MQHSIHCTYGKILFEEIFDHKRGRANGEISVIKRDGYINGIEIEMKWSDNEVTPSSAQRGRVKFSQGMILSSINGCLFGVYIDIPTCI